MKIAKSLGAAVVLTLVIAISGLAAPPCSPGQIETPPCVMAKATTTGEISTPPAGALGQTDTPSVGEVSLNEIASFVLLSIVSLF